MLHNVMLHNVMLYQEKALLHNSLQDSMLDELDCLINGALKDESFLEKLKHVESVLSQFRQLTFEVHPLGHLSWQNDNCEFIYNDMY